MAHVFLTFVLNFFNRYLSDFTKTINQHSQTSEAPFTFLYYGQTTDIFQRNASAASEIKGIRLFNLATQFFGFESYRTFILLSLNDVREFNLLLALPNDGLTDCPFFIVGDAGV